jgi:hypothetical protein
VIFSSENSPDSQTGFEPGISQNNSAVFSRISDIWGSGTLHEKIVSDGDVVQVKEQVLLPVLWGIFDPGKQACFPFYPYSTHL